MPTTVETEESLVSRLETRLKMHSTRLAVAGESTRWSYAELDAASASCASALQDAGENRFAPTVLLMEHDAPLIAAIVGVVRSGGFYLVLNPTHPPPRLRQICNEVRPRAIIVDSQYLRIARGLLESAQQVLLFSELVTTSASFIGPSLSAMDPFALFYTSGSLQKPKPIVYTHGGTLQNVTNHSRALGLHADDRLTLLSPCSAAASVSSLFGALLNGASLYPLNPVREGLHRMRMWIEREEITIYHSVPSLFRHFVQTLALDQVLPSIRAVKLGGEPVFNRDLALFRRHFRSDALLINGLGMTEANGNVCHCRITKQSSTDGVSVPVGEPLHGIEIKLLDAEGCEVATGETGEIALRGKHVTPAFWTGRAVQAYGVQRDGWFRTGDLGRRNRGSLIEHLGRKDDQLKQRGHWVSLAEIEAALMQMPGAREAAVVPVDQSGQQKSIAAFVSWNEAATSARALRSALRKKLPPHSVPSYFFERRKLPLLPNGKIDRPALSRSAAAALIKPARPQPQSAEPIALQLLSIWQQVLEKDDISIKQDFFALGGDSLAAAAIMAGIDKFLRVNLPIAALVQAPTIEKLAYLIRNSGRGANSFHVVGHRLRGKKPPLCYVPGAGCEAFELHALASRLAEEQPVLAFQPRGLYGRSRYHRSVEEMAQSYIEDLRIHQPRGPYYLCGSSFGGVVAFEMARRLTADNEKVAFLGLFDSYGGEYPKARSFTPPPARRSLTLGHLLHGPKALWRTSSAKQLFSKAKHQLKSGLLAIDVSLGRSVFARDYESRILCARKLCAVARRLYKLRPFCGRIDLFRATENQPFPEIFEPDPLLGWSGMAGEGIEVHDLPCGHVEYLCEPHVTVLAQKLSECLDRTQSFQAIPLLAD